MNKYLLTKHPRHTHWWIKYGYLHESYNTIRGVRYMAICKADGFEDDDCCSDKKAEIIIKQRNS